MPTVVNFPGPFVLRLHYEVNATPGGQLSHVASYNLHLQSIPDVGDSFTGILAIESGGGTAALSALVNTWISKFDHLYPSGAISYVEATLWSVEEDSFVHNFLSSYTPTHTPAGSGSVVPGSQVNFSFRTSEGGKMFLNFLDTNASPGLPISYGSLGASFQAMVDWVLNPANNVFLGRDTSYPVSFIHAQTSINRSVFNRRYRP
jgi:hypothetical protein